MVPFGPDSDQVAEFRKAYEEAFNEPISQMDAFEMYARLIRVYTELAKFEAREKARPLGPPEEPAPKVPSEVFLYVIVDGRVLVRQSIHDPKDCAVTVPHGTVHRNETIEAAARRVLRREVTDEPFGVTKLGEKKHGTTKRPLLRHYILAEPVRRPPSRWTSRTPKGPVDFFWISVEDARSLMNAVGEMVPLDQAA